MLYSAKDHKRTPKNLPAPLVPLRSLSPFPDLRSAAKIEFEDDHDPTVHDGEASRGHCSARHLKNLNYTGIVYRFKPKIIQLKTLIRRRNIIIIIIIRRNPHHG